MPLETAGVQLEAAGAAPFTAALDRSAKALGAFTRQAASASQATTAFGQVVTGALRRVGELAVDAFVRAGREALRFAGDIFQASLKGSQFERTMASLRASLVEVTKTTFAPLMGEINQLAQQAAPAILGVVKVAETYLGGLGQNALVWGQNIVNALAQGMWDALGAVIDALTGIGNAITYWLSPGSPPKLLPDLDDWGTEAASVWLEGWKGADFDVFGQISGKIESLIRSMPVGPGGAAGVIPRILGAREGIAQAVQELRTAGQVSQATLDGIIANVGMAGQSIERYVRSLVAMEAANAAVDDAQARLNRVTEEYNALLRPVEDRLAGITEEQQQLAEEQQKSLLALVLKDPNASAAEKQRAQLEIARIDAERERRALLASKGQAVEAAQDELDTAKAAQLAAKEQLDAAAKQIDLQTDQNRLLGEQFALLERLNAAAATLGGTLAKLSGGGAKPLIVEPDTAWIDGLLDKIKEKLAPLVEAWEGAWERIRAALDPAVQAWETYVVPAWNKLVGIFTSTLPEIENAIGRMVAFVVQQLGNLLPSVFRNLGQSLESLANIWEMTHGTILAVVRTVWGAIVTAISIAINAAMGTITIALRIIEGMITGFIALTQGDLSAWATNVKDTWTDVFETAKTTAETQLALISGFFEEHFPKAKKFVDDLLAAITDLWNWITGHTFTFDIQLPNLPEWAIPGSPTPFELGLRGIASALRDLERASLSPPALVRPPMSAAAISRGALLGGGASAYTTNFNYAPVYQGAPASPARDFAIMAVFAR